MCLVRPANTQLVLKRGYYSIPAGRYAYICSMAVHPEQSIGI